MNRQQARFAVITYTSVERQTGLTTNHLYIQLDPFDFQMISLVERQKGLTTNELYHGVYS